MEDGNANPNDRNINLNSPMQAAPSASDVSQTPVISPEVAPQDGMVQMQAQTTKLPDGRV